MRRAIEVHRKGHWPVDFAAGTATLAFDDRHRRRIRLADDAGKPFLLDLPEAAALADGDGLKLDDGAWLHVRAAAEDVCDVACNSTDDLARIAWHLGNRHLPVEIIREGLRLRYDHVIVDMLEALGARVTRVNAPFSPEAGAYPRGAHDHNHHGDDEGEGNHHSPAHTDGDTNPGRRHG